MRVALFHNRYANRGGEDAAFDSEVEQLRKAGCDVRVFVVDSASLGRAGAVRAALTARGGSDIMARVDEFLAENPVDVGHVHNFFPLLTPVVHQVLFDRGVPGVQTLHNYRLACARGDFWREGRNCEECVTAGPWNAVRHGCWRGSRLATAVWADATRTHRRRGTWGRVARFVAPSAFAARKLAGSGIPAERIRVVPNPVEDPGVTGAPGRGAVFAGRLSPEKGGALLLDAWKSVPEFPLTLVGDGPQAAALRERAKLLPNVRFTGALDREGVRAELARAAFLVAPSLCYETFGLAPAEALAAGRAIVVPRATALSELVDGGRGGLLFDAGDADSLARTCVALAADRGRCEALGAEAREVFEERFAAESRVERLLSVYREAASIR